MSPLCKAVTAF